MKRFYYSIFMFLLIFSCSEADKDMFQGPDAVYFRMPEQKQDTTLILREDTIVYSFAFSPELEEREIYIPVEITGFAAEGNRKYKISVEEYGNAKAGVHYDALGSEQVFRGGKTVDSLKVVFHKTDMDNEARKIGITIQSGGDFVQGVKDNLYVAIQVSNILEKPIWWDNWESCLGTYHRIKYEEWMKIWGGQGTLPVDKYPNWNSTPKEITALIELKRIFTENEFYDENNNRLIIPCPF